MPLTSAETVTAADLVRNFAVVRERANTSPVVISNHGRATHVLVGKGEFDRLHASDALSGPLGNPLIELGDWLTDAIVLCDRELVVSYVNRNTEALMRRPASAIVGRRLEDLRELHETQLFSLIERTNLTHEPMTVEIASPFARGAWLRVRALPWRETNVLMFRDITDWIEAQKMANTKGAIIDAMSEHGKVGYVRLSLRGLIDRVDAPFAEMVGLGEERLLGIPFVNLCAAPSRNAMREAIEEAIERRTKQRLEVEIVTNDGKTVRVALAIVSLDGTRGVEGAVIVLTAA
jgi:PAS domain S-box-containing protein